MDIFLLIGVVEKAPRAWWIAGTFMIPKKDGRVWWITDFRGLNKVIVRRGYPLPKIQDIFHRQAGYKYMTKINVSMQYYMFLLDNESKEACTFATPFGLYRYL